MTEITIPTRHRYKELKEGKLPDIKDPVGSKKYDGAAFFLMFDQEGNPRYISRRPSVTGKPTNRTASLPHLSDFQLPEYANKTFHVELYHSGLTKDGPHAHAAVSGVLNSLTPRAIETQKNIGPVRAVVLDEKDDKKTFEEKIKSMHELVEKINRKDVFHAPEFKIGQDEIKSLLSSTAEAGEEGIVVTSLTEPEETNIRYKVKHFDTYNLKIKGLVQEFDIYGQPKDNTGSFIVEDASGKEVANVSSGLTREMKLHSWKNPKEYLGKIIQIKAMPSTANRLRHPIYNGDADGDVDVI